MTKATIFASLLLAVAACRMDARQQAAPPDAAGRARSFVAEFYGWYRSDTHEGRTIGSVLLERPQVFSTELRTLLEADRKCSADSHAICNLDFDPLLNSQDPCEQYEVGGGLAHHDTLGFSVFGVCGGIRDSIPALIAMVLPRDSGWEFSDFAYSREGTDLLTILRRKVGP